MIKIAARVAYWGIVTLLLVAFTLVTKERSEEKSSKLQHYCQMLEFGVEEQSFKFTEKDC